MSSSILPFAGEASKQFFMHRGLVNSIICHSILAEICPGESRDRPASAPWVAARAGYPHPQGLRAGRQPLGILAAFDHMVPFDAILSIRLECRGQAYRRQQTRR
jgi:hypothetical protein